MMHLDARERKPGCLQSIPPENLGAFREKIIFLADRGLVVRVQPRIEPISLELLALVRPKPLVVVPLGVRHRLEPQRRRDPIEGAVFSPASAPGHQRVWVAKDRRQLTPGAAGAQGEHNSGDRCPVINASPAGLPDRQNLLNLSPLRVRQVQVTWHRWSVPARVSAPTIRQFLDFECMQAPTFDSRAALHRQRVIFTDHPGMLLPSRTLQAVMVEGYIAQVVLAE
jgi:hypothetical protein